MTAEEERFVKLVVNPSLAINVATVPEQMEEIMAKMTCYLKSASAEDEKVPAIKVAQASLAGSFDSNPLVLGLSLQAHRMLSKQRRGIMTMRGRRSLESEAERQAIVDSGLQLAILGGNYTMAAWIFCLSIFLRRNVCLCPPCGFDVKSCLYIA